MKKEETSPYNGWNFQVPPTQPSGQQRLGTILQPRTSALILAGWQPTSPFVTQGATG